MPLQCRQTSFLLDYALSVVAKNTKTQYSETGPSKTPHIVYLNPAYAFAVFSRFSSLPSDITPVKSVIAARLFVKEHKMSKYEVIEMIMEINRGAKEDFLTQFEKEDLDLYLEHLMEIDLQEVALVA